MTKLLILGICIEFFVIQYYSADQFPFTNYPMYSSKLQNSQIRWYLCDESTPSKLIPGNVFFPFGTYGYSNLEKTFKKTGRLDLLEKLNSQIISNAAELNRKMTRIQFKKNEFNAQDYRNFLIGPEHNRSPDWKTCSSN